LFFLQEKHSDLFAQVTRIVLYPQYWAARLCGEFASEVTSLGCHTDLWLPGARRFSTLAVGRGWNKLFPPIRSACDALGPVTMAIVHATGLNNDCRVLCGVHDSNASFLGHIANRKSDALAVISSGTWTVIMNRDGELDELREENDMLANVDVFGQPVATARFMGGREYETIAGGSRATPTADALTHVVKLGALALPSFAPAGGPFANRAGQLLNASTLTDAQRSALATVYVALMSDWLLDELDPRAQDALTIVVDGPLAGNLLFVGVLRALRPDDTIRASDGRDASVAAAHFLATGVALTPKVGGTERMPIDAELLARYRSLWRDALIRRAA
jgi:L-fuculokinase